MLRVVAKQHADAGNAWQAASIVAAVDALASPAPAIDPEQLRVLAQGAMDTLTQNKTFPADVAAAAGHVRRLLALIDGQGQPFTGEVQPADLLVEEQTSKNKGTEE